MVGLSTLVNDTNNGYFQIFCIINVIVNIIVTTTSYLLQKVDQGFCLRWGDGGGETSLQGSGDPDFFLHISSSWVKIRLHTKNQLPRLPGSTLKV